MKINVFFVFALIGTCSFSVYAKPTQFYKPYKSSETVENIQPKKYIVGEVNLTLSSKLDAPTFYSQDQIKERYIQKLNEELRLKGLLADQETAQPISVSFDIKQKRVFSGEDLSFLSSKVVGKYAHSTLQYTSTITFNNKPLATYESSERISLGKNGSIGKIVRDLSGKGSPENEKEDIDGFVNYMIEQLPTK
jgi:hypothetical protein